MSANTFGNYIKLTTFGESHGEAIGGIIDGMPSNVSLDFEFIQNELNKRKPGQSNLVTQRKEADEVKILSGIFEGKTTGTPIGFIIENTNVKSKDYSEIKDNFRPSHADFTYQKKYGIRDYKGGGRSSARETACRVVAGAIVKHIIPNIEISSYVSSIGKITLDKYYSTLDLTQIENSLVRCPDVGISDKMVAYLKEIKKQGDTVGGIVTGVIKNMPIGLGAPVFQKLHAQLGNAMLSINAVKGFEFGSGFNGSGMLGSQHNDLFNEDGTTKTNFSGGIQGGISNGMDIYFKVAFKPVATLLQSQEHLTVKGNLNTIQGKGRHDTCVVPRAVPIVNAMAALVIADFFQQQKLT